MSHPVLTAEEVVQRGKALYERQIRAHVESGNIGKYLVLDIGTGDYEVGDNYMTLSDNLHARHPDAALYAMRIGYPAVGRLGGRFLAGGR